MDITQFVISQRDQALALGDHATYRAQLTKRLRNLNRKLGRANTKNAKYAPKKRVTAEELDGNHEFAHVLLYSAERAWALAMQMKAVATEKRSETGITGRPRKQIISKLHQASVYASDLSRILAKCSTASQQDQLEAFAYTESLRGASEFEKQAEGEIENKGPSNERWKVCLRHFSQARVIYSALARKHPGKEVFKDVLNNTVDPSIRYAAYQGKISRSLAVPQVSLQFFPKDDKDLVQKVEGVDSTAFTGGEKQKGQETGKSAEEIPTSITWRGRKATIDDALIGQSLANASAAARALASFAKKHPDASSKRRATAYDSVLVAQQDCSDVVRRAIEEREKEGAQESDTRMQNLRIASLSINYDLVGWRIGRYRALIGDDDGLTLREEVPRQNTKKVPSKKKEEQQNEKPNAESRGHKLGRIKQRLVLYDSIIQSIESVKEFRGALRDPKFVHDLDRKRSYFRILKLLNLAYSHELCGAPRNALALTYTASELVDSLQTLKDDDASNTGVKTLHISPVMISTMKQHTTNLLHFHQATATMESLVEKPIEGERENAATAPPLVERLNEAPLPGTHVDLTKLVDYPPKFQPVPVKPIFLDIAWNYIEYPADSKKVGTAATGAPASKVPAAPAPSGGDEKKKGGWFSFGR